MSTAAVFEDTFNLLCGKLIGEGIHRKVFACKLRPDLVVKVEESDVRHFANVREMAIWQEAQDAAKVWLAPCKFLSPDGRVLLQQRADALPADYALPEKVPDFLYDIKRDNFGLIGGKLVCIDYGLHLPSLSMRLKVVAWQ